MILEINDTNIVDHLINNNIVVNDTFFQKNNLSGTVQIKIGNIHNKTIKILLVNFENTELSIEVKNCSLYGCFAENCILKEFNFLFVEISEHKEAKFKPYNIYFDNCKLDSIWMMECKFFEGFLIRHASEIKSIRCSDTIIENSLTFINSKAETLEIESSNVEYLNIDRSDYPVANSVTDIEKINIFRTKLNFGFKIRDVKFKKINIHKIVVSQVSNLSDHEKSIYVTTPDMYKGIESIEITESVFERDLIITVDDIANLYVSNNTFNYFRINFWKIVKFVFSTNIVIENFFLGYQNHRKVIGKMLFTNNSFDGDFYISDILFKVEFFLISSTFNKFPSFIESCYFDKNCKTDFEFSNFNNLIFQNIDFRNVRFKNFDIINSTFKNCEWKLESHNFYDNYLIFDDNKKVTETKDLILLKKVYSNLKSSFQDKNDFINSSRFYISEQEIKRKITLKTESYFEYSLLSIHKFLSVYGESITKIVCLLFLSIFSFSIIYFFTGFNSGKELINYSLKFECHNFGDTFCDWLKAVILSVKNLVPFNVNTKFYITANESLPLTQTFELIQKIFNFIILASFTETFIKYLKK